MGNLIKDFKDIESKIFYLRGSKVLLDIDLSSMYKVDTKALKRAIKRNIDRFPSDFMFELSDSELQYLKQNGHCKEIQFTQYKPMAFTEQGVAMLSGVLRSDRAVQVNIAIMRAFVEMRRFIQSNQELLVKFEELESKTLKRLDKQDEKIAKIFELIKHLIKENADKRRIGFYT